MDDLHLTCNVIGHPCCMGIQAQCVITTESQCRFQGGTYHPEAALCSQVGHVWDTPTWGWGMPLDALCHISVYVCGDEVGNSLAVAGGLLCRCVWPPAVCQPQQPRPGLPALARPLHALWVRGGACWEEVGLLVKVCVPWPPGSSTFCPP